MVPLSFMRVVEARGEVETLSRERRLDDQIVLIWFRQWETIFEQGVECVPDVGLSRWREHRRCQPASVTCAGH